MKPRIHCVLTQSIPGFTASDAADVTAQSAAHLIVAGVAAEVTVNHGKLLSVAIAWMGRLSIDRRGRSVDGYDLAKYRPGSSLSDQERATSLM